MGDGNSNDRNSKQKKVKKYRMNVFVKNGRKKKRKRNENESNSIVEFNGFGKINQFTHGNGNYEDIEKGQKVRAQKAKIVQKMATGFQSASDIKNNKTKKKRKRGFKPPRIVKNINRKEVEKENMNAIKSRKRRLDIHFDDDYTEEDEIKQPPKKKVYD